ncbi:MAG: N-formylglutamate amidohydrolase [Pseudomonadota bacterium]
MTAPAWDMIQGGSIPGDPGTAAFQLFAPDPSRIPVLIAAPHGGRAYPPALIDRMRNPAYAALRLEDRYVDRLAHGIAAATGAALLVAQAPRAMIDLNRAADDIDWEMIARADGGELPSPAQAPLDPARRGAKDGKSGSSDRRARSGLGLIPRRLPGIGELWKRTHDRTELDARIRQIHEPYHEALESALKRLRDRWGAALLVDLHSMPPLTLRGAPAPEFVIGDRFGATCGGALIGSTFAWFGERRRRAAHNRPYAGGYVLDRHADTRQGLHAFQLEVDRSSYLDARLAECGDGFDGMVSLLSGLVQRLAGSVADAGRGRRDGAGESWAQAAE